MGKPGFPMLPPGGRVWEGATLKQGDGETGFPHAPARGRVWTGKERAGMRELFRLVLLALAALTLGACGAATRPAAPATGPAGYANITVAELKARLDAREPLILLDVRSAEEYTQDGHIAGAMLIPLPELAQRMDELDSQLPVVCICRSGNRSRTACEQLARAGFTNPANVEGGMRAWAAAGYAMERP